MKNILPESENEQGAIDNLLSYLEKIGQTITIIKLNILNAKKGDSASAQ